jgi:hypothetical protein
MRKLLALMCAVRGDVLGRLEHSAYWDSAAAWGPAF